MSRTESHVEKAVQQCYSDAAVARVQELCCPVDYDAQYLEIIPQEIIERDYGCGDPSRHLRPGETVLDLGSGGGKICFIAAQVVGGNGQVIGVDMNDQMLALAEAHREAIGARLGYHNVRFQKGRIQDLALDYRKVEAYLADHPVRNLRDLEELESWKLHQREHDPMIANESIDVVVSNCVLNLVRSEDKQTLFREMHRVLRVGGRAVISDIVSDEDVPQSMQDDPELWSGCISGAYREDAFLEAFAEAGFYGMRILGRDERPWRAAQGIEFRSLTVEAFRQPVGPSLERRQAVIYKGPWSSVTGDDGHTLHRGVRTAVCDKTFRILNQQPYADQLVPVEPYDAVSLEDAVEFDGGRDAVRGPRETKGEGLEAAEVGPGPCCGPEGC